MIYTFYSFKGGVGRSMALANIAELLYEHGLKVLMVDFDLEAPGLERYFNLPKTVTKPPEMALKRGVIDMLLSYLELRSLPRFTATEPTASPASRPKHGFPHPVEPLKEFIASIYEKNSLGGELRIIPAGRRGGEEFRQYAQRIRSFDWDDFYSSWDGEAFFEWFRNEAENLADVVLIDSRTGVSEMSGVCTYQLADMVIMFVAPNQQNLDGTVMMADSLLKPKLIEQRGRKISLLFVPSRVEYNEAKLLDDFARQFEERLGPLSPGVRGLKGAGFDDLKLVYVPQYAYMEKVAVREPDRASASDLIKAYEKITAALAQLEPENGKLRKLFYPDSVQSRAQIYLSYRRGSEPDESVARHLYTALSQDHDVFFDELITIGVDWAKYIQDKVTEADFLVALISPSSAQSELFLSEIEYAHNVARSRGGKPAFLPVRLDYNEPLHYPLSVYLDRLQPAHWEGHEDTPRLTSVLLEAISRGESAGRAQPTDAAQINTREASLMVPPLHSAQPEQLETAEGVMDSQSAFYVVRQADSLALEAITSASGATVTIKGPQQMGKSSLLIRTVEAARRADKRVAFIDFQIVDKKALCDPELFFRMFCQLITNELDLEDRADEYWSLQFGNAMRCTRYFSRYVLKELNRPLVLAMDEVDVLFDTEFRSDFFGMLRSWHNSRAVDVRWRQLDLVLVISTEPYQLIEDLNQSPFNVGEVLELDDFTPEQVADLNQRHGAPLHHSELRQLMDLIGGHPYLVRRALYLLASGTLATDDLFTQATSDTGPFGDHLRRHLFRLYGKEDQISGLREVIKKQTCSDDLVFFRLRGAGLVYREGRAVLPSCRLYGDYFKERLNA